MVPRGLARPSRLTTSPSLNDTWLPTSSDDARVSSSTPATAAMLGRASPRKPRLDTFSRSSRTPILLVACLRKASSNSPAGMPDPLSLTFINSTPPPRASTAISVAPASREFSISSFTTEAGLSITSPAAILETTSGARTLIVI